MSGPYCKLASMTCASSIVAQIPALRRYARALTHDPWAADDLVQDTLERACHKWQLWRSGSDLRAWLFTLMHNVAISDARRTARQPLHNATDLDDVKHQTPAPDEAVATVLDVQTCLSRLPVDQREVLLLITLESLSYEAAAKILGVPIGTVMSRLSRARVRMRECLLQGGCTPATAPTDATQPLRRIK